MSCLYCERCNGLNEFCYLEIMEDYSVDIEFVETGNEFINCDYYSYNGELKHYDFLSGEKEVKQIIKNLIEYSITMSLDEIALGVEKDYSVYLTHQQGSTIQKILEELEEV